MPRGPSLPRRAFERVKASCIMQVACTVPCATLCCAVLCVAQAVVFLDMVRYVRDKFGLV